MADLAEFGELQSQIAAALVERATGNATSIKLRVEMQDDNGSLSASYTAGHDTTRHALKPGPGIYRLSKALRARMAEEKGDYWKVMLFEIDVDAQRFNAQFEYEDASKWDESKYRGE